MDADPRAPIHESGEIDIDAAPDHVWDTLTDFESWPRWLPGVKSIAVHGPAAAGTRFEWGAGPGKIKSQLVEADRPAALAWTGRTLGIRAVHTWSFEPGPAGGTHVSTAESWSGPLPRLLPGLLAKAVRKAIDEGLPALKEEAERRRRST